MKPGMIGGLALALSFAAGFGLAKADQDGDGLPPAAPAAPAAPATPAPAASPISPAVQAAIKGNPNAIGARLKSTVTSTFKDATDPMSTSTFVGGIAMSDLAQAGLDGLTGNATAKDEVGDLGHALTTPEFYAGVGLFNAVYPKTEALAGKALGLDYVTAATAGADATVAQKIAGGAASAAKKNIALGLTMTAMNLVKVDFNGFNLLTAGKDVGKGLLGTVEQPFKTAGDIIRHPSSIGSDISNGLHNVVSAWSPLGSQAKTLLGTRVHLGSIPMVKEKWCPFPLPEDLAITLGSFAAAGPIWGAVKTGLGMFAKRFLVAEAAEHTVMGPIEIGEVAVQPEGPGEVADGVEEAGEGIGAFAYAAITGAIDLGGLLFTANQIQKPIQNWNDQRVFQDAAQTAMQNYLAVTKQNGGNPDPTQLQNAMSNLATSMADLRDFHYLPVAIEDAQFVNRLENDGVTTGQINAVGQQVMSQDGAWLAAPGQTAALESTFAPGKAIPGTDQSTIDGLEQRHDAEVAKLLAGVENAPTVPAADLNPAGSSFQWSQNRNQLYDQEIAILAAGGNNLTNKALQQSVLQDMQVVGSLAQAEQTLITPALPKSVGLTNALQGGTAPATTGTGN